MRINCFSIVVSAALGYTMYIIVAKLRIEEIAGRMSGKNDESLGLTIPISLMVYNRCGTEK